MSSDTSPEVVSAEPRTSWRELLEGRVGLLVIGLLLLKLSSALPPCAIVDLPDRPVRPRRRVSELEERISLGCQAPVEPRPEPASTVISRVAARERGTGHGGPETPRTSW